LHAQANYLCQYYYYDEDKKSGVGNIPKNAFHLKLDTTVLIDLNGIARALDFIVLKINNLQHNNFLKECRIFLLYFQINTLLN